MGLIVYNFSYDGLLRGTGSEQINLQLSTKNLAFKKHMFILRGKIIIDKVKKMKIIKSQSASIFSLSYDFDLIRD